MIPGPPIMTFSTDCYAINCIDLALLETGIAPIENQTEHPQVALIRLFGAL